MNKNQHNVVIWLGRVFQVTCLLLLTINVSAASGMAQSPKGHVDIFKTVNLASEIANSGYVLSTQRKVSKPLGEVSVESISLSCVCVKVSDGKDEFGGGTKPVNGNLNFSEPVVEMKLKFGGVVQSDSQSARIMNGGQHYSFEWQAVAIDDISCDLPAVYVDLVEGKVKSTTAISAEVAFSSREEFEIEDKPTFSFSETVIADASFEPKKTEIVDGIHVQSGTVKFKLAENPKADSGKPSMLVIEHPHKLGIDHAGKNFRSYQVPIMMAQGDSESFKVSFGVAKAGKKKSKIFADREFSLEEIKRMSAIIKPPFTVDLSDNGELTFSVDGDKPGRYWDEFKGVDKDGNSAVFKLKAIIYKPE